jgi:cell division protein FtsZ
MALEFNISAPEHSIIKVIGVGGGGGNAVNQMYHTGIKGVEFIICNTDRQVLEKSPVPVRIQIGKNLTEGLGCGADPDKGRKSAEESIEEIREILRKNTKMVFVTAGMGGGTGTGAAPVIAKLAREMGILTIGIVTTPFKFEGVRRMEIAHKGIEALGQVVDSLLVINNASLSLIAPKNAKVKDAFLLADRVLVNATKGIAEIISREGLINVDFADVAAVMRDSGKAIMGIGRASGDNRALKAVEEALSSPLLDNHDIHGATGILWCVYASEDTFLQSEMDEIGEYIHNAVGENANVIFGMVYDESLKDELSVTVVATGFDHFNQVSAAVPAKAREVVNSNNSTSIQPGATTEQTKTQTQKSTIRLVPKSNELPNIDFHDAKALTEAENTPAYLRNRITLNMSDNQTSNSNPTVKPGNGTKILSRLSLEDNGNGSFQIRDNNSFIYDNVD